MVHHHFPYSNCHPKGYTSIANPRFPGSSGATAFSTQEAGGGLKRWNPQVGCEGIYSNNLKDISAWMFCLIFFGCFLDDSWMILKI